MSDHASRPIGARVRRVEDPRLVVGKGCYVDDLQPPGTLYAGFARSLHAHARLLSVDVSAARALPGVVAVYGAADLPEAARETACPQVPAALKGHGWYPLASGKVRFVGEPVAVVVAVDRETATDAAEAVEVEYEPLQAVPDIGSALSGAQSVWDDVPDNRALEITVSHGDVTEAFALADVIVEERFEFSRAAGAAMEPRSLVAAPDPERDGRIVLWDSTQAPHSVRDAVTAHLGMEAADLRVVTPDVGGGFGPKGRTYPEEFVLVALARRHGAPIKWVATRTEDLLTTGQGRAQIHEVRMAARSDGTILGFRDRITQDIGAYTPGGLPHPLNTLRHTVGPYVMPAAQIQIVGVYTNAVMTCPLRGGGRPEGVFAVERALDRMADRLGMDRVEIRRRNFIPKAAFPYTTGLVVGGRPVIYDSGNFPLYLEKTLDAVDVDAFRRRQTAERAQGRYLGLGISAFIESTGVGDEEASLTLEDDGAVTVSVGSPSQGQGHATAFAQVAAAQLGIDVDRVHYTSGDTAAVNTGTGTFASRMGIYGGNAVLQGSLELREKILSIASDLMEIASSDLEIHDGRVSVRGFPERGMRFEDIAQAAFSRGDQLRVCYVYQPERHSAWAGGVQAAIVEIDPDTGRVSVERYIVVHDAGTLINPTIVEGQIHGGVAHGIGNVLHDSFVYDHTGQPQTATFADYTLPQAADVPEIEIIHVETPSPFNPLGVKGCGEGGTIGALPTLASAIEDALQPFGVRINRLPVSMEEIATTVLSSTRSSLGC
ncbi:MAG: molybdopterin-dependent oxidoreductase [Chloroflexota bacterium]